ncbi:MAG: DUF1707 domain-containing protein [Acidobacteriota bacterium]|nr:DUF1707 domain-containing protein [Acidobacteriota bacterium]
MSDDDRRRVVEELGRHCGAGRIDIDEFARRVERALAASTFQELDAVRADLPMVRIAEPRGRAAVATPSAASLEGRALLERRNRGLPSVARVRSSAGVVITGAVAAGAAVVGVVGDWTWAVLLLAGWAAGLAQGRLRRRRAT